MSSTTSLRSALPLTRLGSNTHKYLLRSSTNRGISTTPLHPLLRTTKARRQQKTSLSIHPSSRTTQLPIIASIFKSLFGSWGPSSETMSAAKTQAENIVKENAVVVFSKSHCPFCQATKNLLQEQGAKFYLMELDQVDDGPAIQEALQEITGQRTVPNVFINHKHIGGNSEVQALQGQLPALLKEAGAI